MRPLCPRGNNTCTVALFINTHLLRTFLQLSSEGVRQILTFKYTYTYISLRVCVYVCVSLSLRLSVHVLYVCLSICVCTVCMYKYICLLTC